METLLQSLPGMEMPISEIADFLSHLWMGEPSHPGGEPMHYRASQMNLVLHLGLDTKPDEAKEIFQTALDFAQRYPSRIIVLCPETSNDREQLMRAKVYTQCFIGESGREKSCSEALLLGYQPGDQGFLENQVSIWLESDLPFYHWFHRVPASRISSQYLSFTKRSQRVLIDTALGDSEEISSIKWPEGVVAKDFAEARGLPLRQMIGQFLSGFEPLLLVEGLQKVVLKSNEGLSADRAYLCQWITESLKSCAEVSDIDASWEVSHENFQSDDLLWEMIWHFENDRKAMHWVLEKDGRHAYFDCKMQESRSRIPFRIQPLSPSRVLAETIFFD